MARVSDHTIDDLEKQISMAESKIVEADRIKADRQRELDNADGYCHAMRTRLGDLRILLEMAKR